MDPEITTLGSLLAADKKSPAELAELIALNGVYFKDRFGAWRAAQPKAAGTEAVIENALDAVSEWYHIHDSPDQAAVEEYWKYPDHQPVDGYGFHVDRDGMLFVESTAVQTQAELIQDLRTQVEDLTKERDELKEAAAWTGFDDVDEELIPEDLDIALQVYREASRKFDPTSRTIEGKTPKEWLKDKASSLLPAGASSTKLTELP
ncbi:MAG: hypothetical protein HOG56_04720 [Gammaproteobacteria bacterium]|jgi:hypothetical protein|nr:hypothetical protein [Gammaproteobacteria bacterium]